MKESALQSFLREKQRLRVESETSRYLLRKLVGARDLIPFFAIDARTGIARREILDVRAIPPDVLLQAPA